MPTNERAKQSSPDHVSTAAPVYAGNATEHANAAMDFNDDGCRSITSTGCCELCLTSSKVYWIFCSCDTKDKYYDPESQGYVGIHKLCGDCLSNEDVPPWSPNGVERAKSRVARLFASTTCLPDLALDKIASYLVCDMKP